MPNWLFPDFLRSPEKYAQAQQYWERLWEKVLGTIPGEQRWDSPWLHNPDQDGNPMFSAVCVSLSRGVCIIQEEPGEADEFDLDWWIDCFGEKTAPDAIRKLVVACCPSRENAGLIEQLLQHWVRSGELPATLPTIPPWETTNGPSPSSTPDPQEQQKG